jgi:hypothetical protein
MQKKTLVLVGIILLKFALQYFLISPEYELQRDEYLHLDQGKHLAWGYISVPPVTSWISRIILLLGGGVFWVKFFPFLFGALTILVVWKIAEELRGGLFACVLAALAVLVSAILRLNILYQPNSFDVFFWTLSYYCLIKIINTQKPFWYYAAALSLAFGFLSKYNILFLVAGLFPALLLSSHRNLLANKHFFGGLLLAFLIVSPNLLWQYKNGFPTVSQLKELAETQLVNVDRTAFLKDQLLFFFSSLFVIMAALVGLAVYPPFKKFRFLLLSFLLTVFLFLYFKAKSYYAMGLYPAFLSFGAVYLERLFSTGWKRYLRPVSIALVLMLSLPLIYLAFPLRSPAYFAAHPQPYKDLGLLRWEDGKDHLLPQDFADMVGWKELARKTDSAYKSLPPNETTLVLCDNYGQAGAINYYSSVKGMQAVSFNADYIDWMPLDKPIKNVVLVQFADDDDTARQREKPWFEKITLAGRIENPFAREAGTRIYILQGAKTDINAILQKEIDKRKRRNANLQ